MLIPVMLIFLLKTIVLTGSELIEPTLPVTNSNYSTYYLKQFESARQSYYSGSNDVNIIINFGKSAFEWAEFATNKTQRAQIASEGISACKRGVELAPSNGAVHYWLAMNLAQLARTKGWSALKIVKEMETEYLTAITLQPEIDYAGPHRLLGLLYRDAPGWPLSIGNKQKAKFHLETAVKLCPDFPDNQLFLIETYLMWGDKKSAQKQFEIAKKIMEDAKKKYVGEQWLASHADWDARWQKILKKLNPDN